MIIVMSLGYLQVMRYLVQVFQTASFGGNSPWPSTSSGPAVVEVQAPVGDVAVVADPVEQLAAADVVVPAPVHVHAALDVRLHLATGRSRVRNPVPAAASVTLMLVPVPAKSLWPLGSPTSTRVTLPISPLRTISAALRKWPCERCQEPVCQMRLFFCTALHDGLLLGDGAGQRLLAVDILLVLRALRSATSACQLSGTASITASMSLRAIISR